MTDWRSLRARQLVRAPIERVFDAWTRPGHIVKWWGPRQVSCPDAIIELKVGGRYRIANRFADGSTVWISGTYLEILRPRRLVFSWTLEGAEREAEKVTVEFQKRDRGAATLVEVLHEKIADPETMKRHKDGWTGCLDGLARYLGAQSGD